MYNTNQPSEYTRVTYRDNPSFCERVRKSLLAIVVGLILLCGAVGLLFWNEGRAVQTAKSLDEGLNLVISLPNADNINEYHYSKLVHVIGDLRTGQVIHDEKYQIALPTVKLKRNVEMYQWVEHEQKREINEGDRTREETSYSYTQEWRDHVIRSDSFEQRFSHENPSEMPISSSEYQAKDASVGVFYLSENLMGKINNWKVLTLHKPPSSDPTLKIHKEQYYYHGTDPMYPKVGDVRVSFQYAGLAGKSSLGPSDKVSVVGKQLHGQISGYQTHAGDVLEILYMGEHTAQAIFGMEQSQNTMLTWGLRLLGWLIMFCGFTCLTQILNTIVDWIPLVRTVVAVGTVALNTSLSISLSLLVIALGWIRYRPLLGITLLLCSMLPFVLERFRRHNNTNYSRMRVD